MNTITNSINGISTGYREVDRITDGFHKSDLIILTARTGIRVTLLALDIAGNIAKVSDANVLMFNCNHSKDWLLGMHPTVSKRINIEDNAELNIHDIETKCRETKEKDGLDLVVVDSLCMIDESGRINNETEEAIKKLKLLAQELDCIMMVIYILPGTMDRRFKNNPKLKSLSKSVQENADEIIFLYWDEYYHCYEVEPTEVGICEVTLVKSQYGPPKKTKILWKFTFDTSWAHWISIYID